MKTPFTIIVFNLMLTTFAQASECTHRIIFLPQTHAIDRETTGSVAAQNTIKVAASQLSIMKYLEANAERPVFSEQAVSDTTEWQTLPETAKAKFREIATKNFAGSLPGSLYQATEGQIADLNEIDAASMAFIREKIPSINAVISREDKETVFGPINKWMHTNPGRKWTPEITNLVRDTRERLAIREVLKHFEKHPEHRDAVLIFGSNHNFSIYPDLINPECVVVPFEFQRDWYGMSRGGYTPAQTSMGDTGVQ